MRIFCATELDSSLKNKLSIDFIKTHSKPSRLDSNDYWLEINNDLFHLSGRNKDFSLSVNNFIKWSQSWATLPASQSTTSHKLQKVIKRFVTTIVDAKLVASVKNEALITFLGREETRELERSWRSPHMLPRVVLNLKEFSDYETCQLFIHERGRGVAESWSCSNKQDITFSKTSTNNFNKIFNYIKKSKSKLFDQSVSMLSDVSVVGNFLAKEFSFQNHSGILFLSRNGFLPPGEDELLSFNALTSMITPFLDRLLTQEHAGERLNHLMMLMESLPIPLQVLDQNELVIFENNSFKSKDESADFVMRSVSLSSGYKLIIHEEGSHSFDIDHHRRVSLLGELLNTLQHELNNPLFGLNLGAQDMSEENTGEVAQTFSDIATNSARCQTIIKNFSNLYSHSKNNTAIHIKDFVNEIFILTKSEIRGINVSINFHNFTSDESFIIKTNPTTLSQVLFNLIINAGQAIKGQVSKEIIKLNQGAIELNVYFDQSYIDFEIKDNGPGLSEEFFKNALKPFYTTKALGTGLGLTISRGLLESIGSSLKVSNNSGVPGANFGFSILVSPNS